MWLQELNDGPDYQLRRDPEGDPETELPPKEDPDLDEESPEGDPPDPRPADDDPDSGNEGLKLMGH
jgi:hypothetical protein